MVWTVASSGPTQYASPVPCRCSSVRTRRSTRFWPPMFTRNVSMSLIFMAGIGTCGYGFRDAAFLYTKSKKRWLGCVDLGGRKRMQQKTTGVGEGGYVH